MTGDKGMGMRAGERGWEQKKQKEEADQVLCSRRMKSHSLNASTVLAHVGQASKSREGEGQHANGDMGIGGKKGKQREEFRGREDTVVQ